MATNSGREIVTETFRCGGENGMCAVAVANRKQDGLGSQESKVGVNSCIQSGIWFRKEAGVSGCQGSADVTYYKS